MGLKSRAALFVAASFVAAMALMATSTAADAQGVYDLGTHRTLSGSGNCPWNGGTLICEYGVSYLGDPYPTGQDEAFGVGTSHAVWTYWDDSNGVWHWSSLGGKVYSPVAVYSYSGNYWNVIIRAVGGDDNDWCDERGGQASANSASGWSGWYLCPEPPPTTVTT